MLIGSKVSSGIAIGKAFVIKEEEFNIIKIVVKDELKELERFNEAVQKGMKELHKVEKNKDIFESHLMILEDPEFVGSIREKILDEKVNSEYAVQTVIDKLIKIFKEIEDEYIKERISDIKDVGSRILSILKGESENFINVVEKDSIIIGKDITPSQTAQMKRKKVLGFATEIGGVTSHSAIIGRNLGIPVVVGIKNLLNEVNTGDLIILDGNKGIIIINPDEETLEVYRKEINKIQEEKNELLNYKNLTTFTLDLKRLQVNGSIGNLKEAEDVNKNGGEGIGLFRTEFLYMENDGLPSEEEQFNKYKEVLKKFKDKPVVIRTLDIGGDKKLSYLPMEEELNPFLGLRAIRLCLNRKDIFKTQLRALLRASIYGNLQIMFPMICNLNELRKAKKLLDECKVELEEDNIKYNKNLLVGIMIEVPSAAIISDILAKEVDFFSIGTNDLMQYTLAVDRTNEKISYLYDFNDLAVLRLIKLVIENAHKAGIPVGMCGEMASREELIPLLIGMGLDEFSVSPSSILKIRKIIRSLNYIKCKRMVVF
ncbi:phosphoenolpyruvate--protein phosphotransferase [Clostridium malenominatum]|uniref:Phosphoenolpyruvate-protein phosphotransferase n=1 Tax=Clostridium malenominatum TaxID=1539 RepID=A0ABN1IZB9_9CLOT